MSYTRRPSALVNDTAGAGAAVRASTTGAAWRPMVDGGGGIIIPAGDAARAPPVKSRVAVPSAVSFSSLGAAVPSC